MLLMTLASVLGAAAGWELECGDGAPLRGFQSLYSPAKRDRVMFAPRCGSPIQRAACSETLEPLSRSWMAECEGFVSAMEDQLVNGTRRFRILCCKGPETIRDSCFETSPGGFGESFELSLRPGQVLKAVRSTFDYNLSDQRFNFKICTLSNVSAVEPSMYSFYPSSQSGAFGSGSESAYATLCVAGKFLRRLDSVWGPANGDRALMGHCEGLRVHGLHCDTVREAPLDEADEAGGVSPPAAASLLRGCSGQEVMSAWTSKLEDGVRRHSFGCCALRSPMVEPRDCRWEKTKLQEAFSISAPPGHVFRGVKAAFDLASGDRAFEVEICPLSGFEDSSRCLAQTKKLQKREKHLVMEVFLHVGVRDVEECLRLCWGHPFCLSAGYQPTLKGSEPVCLLSYRRTGVVCSAESAAVPTAAGPSALWLQCVRCPAPFATP